MFDLPKELRSKLARRTEHNALRKLPCPSDSIDFSSNDYLGFARDENIHNSALRLLSETGQAKNGATGSRLLTGNHRLYQKLESRLAEIFNARSALVFNSGYDANIGFFSSVPQRGDFVYYDEHIHASIRDGIKMGNAKNYKFKHNDLNDLKRQIARSAKVRKDLQVGSVEAYIVTESVFSMDGDSPDLRKLSEFCTGNGFRLIVDEAHAMGVVGTNGKGLVQQLGIQDQVFARIVTFGKALGGHGAAVLGDNDLIGYLTNFARSFVYTTALPPHSVATILVALEIMVSDLGNKQIGKLQGNIDYFRNKVGELGLEPHFIPADSAIQSCLIKRNGKVKNISAMLGDNGFDVKPILSPTVPEGRERLRFCIHSFNTEEEISRVLELLAKFS